MALITSDRVKEYSVTNGTGDFSLSGAATGFQSFVDGIGDTNTCYYVISLDTDWEVGLGTVVAGAPDLLQRTTIHASSNGNALVNFPAGTKNVFTSVTAFQINAIESDFDSHVIDSTIHFIIDDNIPSSTSAYSSTKIQNELDLKSNTTHIHPAIDITYDDTNTDLQGAGSPIIEVQSAIEKLDLKRRFKNTTHTGLIDGGLMTTASSTEIDISDGNGVIIDQVTTPAAAIGILVSWTGLTTITVTQELDGFGATYIFMNNTGTISQFLIRPSKQTFINNIYLGVVYYEANAITVVYNSPDVVDSTAVDFGDFVDFGVPNIKGVTPIAIGAGDPNSVLEFYVTDGQFFALGINWHTDRFNPNIIQIPANGTDTTGVIPWGSGAVFDYILGDGTVFATNQTILDETIFDNGNDTPGTVPNGDGLIHFIIKLPGGKTYVQPYTKIYRDWKGANSSLQAAFSDFVLANEIKEGIVIGAYIGQQNTTDWERGDRSSLTGLGSSGGGGGSSGATIIEWGLIQGTLNNQTDLQVALDLKADTTSLNSHINNTTVHFTEASIDHTNILSIGTNTHTQIDSHINNSTNPHSTSIDNLSNTIISSPANNQGIVYNGSNYVNEPIVKSQTSGITGAGQVINSVTISQADYDSIGTPNINTIYYIVG